MRIWIPVAVLVIASAAFAEVSITPVGKDFHIKAAQYEATVAADGAMPSVLIQGQEFFDKTKCRGLYLYDTTVMRFDNVTKVDDATLKAESDKATLLYLFTDDAIKLRMTNKETKPIELVMVYDLGVKALRDSNGKYYKPPLQRNWEKTTWFRPPARLTITGGTSIWGPWSGEHQVFRGIIDPGATREVTMEAAMATAEEQAKAKEIAERVVLPPADPIGPMWDLKKFSQVPQVWPAEGFDSGDERIKAIYFAGPPYDGKPTKVFAWVGIPKAGETPAPRDGGDHRPSVYGST